MLRACSRAQHRPDSSMGAPDWPPPATLRPRAAVLREFRRRRRLQTTLAIRSVLDAHD